MGLDQAIETVLLSEEQLQKRIDEIAKDLSEEYADKNPIFVGVLKGVVLFFSDVVKRITVPCEIDFMCISSYSGTNSTGAMQVKKDVSADIKGRHVVILEDIFDTGGSLQFTWEHLSALEPASLKIVTLLDKPARRKPGITVKADITGFTIEDNFVVGYGLDYNEQYRNLPYVGILKREVYEKN